MRLLILVCLLSPFILGATVQDGPPIVVPTDPSPTPAPTPVPAPTGPVDTNINWNTFLPLLVSQLIILATALAGLWKSITQGSAIQQLQVQQTETKHEVSKAQDLSVQNQKLLQEAKCDVNEAKAKAAETKQIVENIAKSTGTGGVPPTP